ncbi:MAG: arabinofuranosidase catalytic domain-containing protein [Dolichospermum sp.]|jgi:hypothetical protein
MAFRFGPGPILDSFPGAQAAYSLRKLSSAYTGPILTVRRSSDNATTNIGLYRYTIDTDAILSFVGNGNGFVTTWYDQSGNGVNLVQGNTALQFNIVTSGSLHYEGNEVVMNAATDRVFTRNTSAVTLNDWTIYVKSKMTGLYGHYVGHPASATGFMQHFQQGLCYYFGGYNNLAGGSGAGYSTDYRKIQAKRNATSTNVRGYQNGVNLGNSNINTSLDISTNSHIFGNFAGGGYSGTIRECIIYPVEHSDFTISQINNMS